MITDLSLDNDWDYIYILLNSLYDMNHPDLLYYKNRKDRYEHAVPKLKKMIRELEVGNDTILTPYGERKRTALIHELGRIQGVLAVLNSLDDVVEKEIKTTYADILVDMIHSSDHNNFAIRWWQLTTLETIMRKKGLRTLIWIGSERIQK